MDVLLNPEAMMLIGATLIIIELLTFASMGGFIFLGAGAIVTSIILYSSSIIESPEHALYSISIFSSLAAGILWNPLKRMQNAKPSTKEESDLIGVELELTEDLIKGEKSTIEYSGVTWNLTLDKDCLEDKVSKGSTVIITSVKVGEFNVTKK